MSNMEQINMSVVLIWSPLILQTFAILLTIVLAAFLARRSGLSAIHMSLAGIVAIFGAMLGGRMWADPELVATGEIFSQLIGSYGVIGVLTGGAVFACAYIGIGRLPLLTYADVALPAVIAGYVIARLGCLAAGDDFGLTTDMIWGVRFGPDTEAYFFHLSRGWIEAGSETSLVVHPTQLYHIIAAGIIFSILHSSYLNSPVNRIIFTVVSFALARFTIQFLRDDHGGGPIDQTQWICLLFVLGGGLSWIWARYKYLPDKTAVIT